MENQVKTKGPKWLDFKDLMSLSLRSFKNRRMRTFLTIAGMGVGIGAVLFLVSLGYGLQFILVGRLAATSDALLSMEAFFPQETNEKIDANLLNEINQISEVAEISKIAELPGQIIFNNLVGNTSIRIIEDNYFRLFGSSPEFGKPPVGNEPKVILSSAATQLLGLEFDETIIGKEVNFVVLYPQENNGVEVIELEKVPTISALIRDDTQPYIMMNADLLPRELNEFQGLIVKADNSEVVKGLRDKLIDFGFIISAKIDLIEQVNKVLDIITTILGIFGVTALFVSAIGMFNTMTISLLERTFEIGIMKSIGATNRDIRNLFLTESFLMGLLGGVGGVLIGLISAEIFNLILNIIAKQFGGSSVDLFITPIWFVTGIITFSSIIGFTTGLWPAIRASKLSIKETLLR